jgi:outer membrane protein assembly factor BamB
MVVADDASVLAIDMDTSGMIGGGSFSMADRELVNIDENGNERWRVGFEDGWLMMPCTNGDLVVVVLVDDWFMGFDRTGDSGWTGGGMGGGMNNGGPGPGNDESVLVALDLATGQERWRTAVEAGMASKAQFSPDGSKIYLSVIEMGSGSGMGHGPVRQGGAAGAGFMRSSTVVAFDRDGNQRWTYELGGQ